MEKYLLRNEKFTGKNFPFDKDTSTFINVNLILTMYCGGLIMKNRVKRILNFSLLAITLVILSIVIAGCSSTSNQPAIQSSSEGTPVQTATTTTSAPITSTIIPITSVTTSAQLEMGIKSDTGTQIESTTKVFKPFTNDLYRISMIYPADWEKEELEYLELRDYGQRTINIVNFFSPTRGSNYNTFSVDVDPNCKTDPDDYYNHAILALQTFYGRVVVTKHMSNWKISDQTAYRIDYLYYISETKQDQKAIFIVTKLDEDIYIISFRGYDYVFDDNLDEAEAMLKSIKITPKTEEKHR